MNAPIDIADFLRRASERLHAQTAKARDEALLEIPDFLRRTVDVPAFLPSCAGGAQQQSAAGLRPPAEVGSASPPPRSNPNPENA